MNIPKPTLLFVGAFPPPNKKVFGGIVTSCKTLLDAGLVDHFDVILLDSTQRSEPPANILLRMVDSLSRMYKYISFMIIKRPNAIIIFVSSGLSFLEKSLFAALGHFYDSYVVLSPRAGKIIDNCRRNKLYGAFVKFMMKFPDCILCQGEAWRNFFVNEMKLTPAKYIILKNWTATQPLLSIGERRTYNAAGKFRILFIGRIYREKGIFELIDAFSMLYSQYKNIELDIAGEGKASAEVRKHVIEKGLSDKVNFLGWVDESRKLQVLSDATIFCLPSYEEGLPNTMIEAMATGLPVVVTPVGAVANVIRHGQNGLLCSVGNPKKLSQQIENLIIFPEMRERIGRRAHLTAASEHNARQAVIRLKNIISKGTKNESW